MEGCLDMTLCVLQCCICDTDGPQQILYTVHWYTATTNLPQTLQTWHPAALHRELAALDGKTSNNSSPPNTSLLSSPAAAVQDNAQAQLAELGQAVPTPSNTDEQGRAVINSVAVVGMAVLSVVLGCVAW